MVAEATGLSSSGSVVRSVAVETIRKQWSHVRENYWLHPIVAIYLLTIVIPVGFHVGDTFLNLQRCVLLVLIIPLFVSFLCGRAGRFILTDFLFLFALVWMPISLFQTTPTQAISFSGSVGIEFFGGYLIGRIFIRSRADLIALFRTLVLIVLCLLPFAIFETLTSRPLLIEMFNQLPDPFRRMTDVQHAPRMGFYRAQTVFVHPILSGLFCSVVFSLCYVGLQGVFSDTRRLIYSTLVFLTAFLSLSSGALLALLLQLALIGWAFLFKKLTWRWWLLVGLLVLTYVAIDILSNRTPLRVFMSYATFSAHNAFWRSIIFEWGMMNVFGSTEHGIPAAPMFGIGLNSWVRPDFMRSESVDNFWLVLLMRHGTPYALAIMFGYGFLLVQLLRLRLQEASDLFYLRRAICFSLIGLAFTLSTVHVWNQTFSFLFFILGASSWLVHAKTEGNSEPTSEDEDFNPAERRATEKQKHLPYSRFAYRPVKQPSAVASLRSKLE